MEKHSLPFKPGRLALAIAASILASYPTPKIVAAERVVTDSEWSCSTSTDGQWNCRVVTKKPAAIRRAPLTDLTIGLQRENQTNEVATTTPTRKHPLDWVPREQLSEARTNQLPYYSCGAYVEPDRPGKHFEGDPGSAEIILEANESTYDEGNIARLTGNVYVRQASRQLTSDSASFNRDTNHGDFEGNVHFRENNLLILSEKGGVQLDTGRATLENATYVMHEENVRGNADLMVRNEDGTLDLTNATYTACPPGDKGWLLSSSNVSLDQETGRGVAKNASVRVQGVPILYTPWISFPIDDRRMSGFLYPTISLGGDNGFDYSQPYYWNIAPNYDATITPRVMSERGVLLENEFRYLISNTQGELGFAGLLNKDNLKKGNPYYDEQRWLINLRQQTQLTSNWTATVDYAKASDKKYLNDFESGLNLSSHGSLNQSISTRYNGSSINNSWYASIDAHQYQNMSRTSDDPYNTLPEVIISGLWDAGEKLDVSYTANYTKFTRDQNWDYINQTLVAGRENVHQSHYSDGYGIKRANGERAYFETGLSYPMEASYGFLTPAVKVQHVQYQLSNLKKDQVIADLSDSYDNFTSNDYTESPDTTVPTFSVDGGLYFDRLTDFGGTAFTHTLEPRMKYLYAPHAKGQAMNPIFDTSLQSFSYSSLWRDSRFSGYDRLADNNQVSIGLTSRLIEEDGFERVRFGIGQIFYFADRKVWISPTSGTKDPNNPDNNERNWDENLNETERQLLNDMKESTSPLATELVYNINRSMSVRQDLMYDANNNEVDNYGLYYTYKPDSRKVLNIGYRFRDQSERYVKNSDDQNIPDGKGGYKTTKNDLSQSDVSFAWPVMPNWSALGRWQYDITNKRQLEQMAGVEYNSCCYQVRLLWRHWIEDDSNIDYPDKKKGIFLQFVLRGLGNLTGGSVSEYLHGIKGYEWDEK